MQRRTLGRTDLEVPVITLGAWAIGGWQWGGTQDEAAIAALREAPSLGMTAIDTAPVYGFGHSEVIVGRAIAGRRDEYEVLTKVGLRWDDDRGVPVYDGVDQDGKPRKIHKNGRPDSVRHEVEQSLARLGVEVLDLVQMHWPDETTPVADTMGALLELRAEGKLRHIGVSNYMPDLMEQAQQALGDVPLASTQPRYSLVFREHEEAVLPWAAEHGVGGIVYSPLAQGQLTGKVSADREFPDNDIRAGLAEFSRDNRARIASAVDDALRPVAAAHGATVAQVALAWTVAQTGVTSAIAGVRTSEQLAENAGAGSLTLTPDEIQSIRARFEALELDLPSA